MTKRIQVFNDGLVVLRNVNARVTDKMRKIIIKMFKKVGFQLEIKIHIKKVEFLNVTFNLITGSYTPYKKPKDNLLYINTSSDHPPQIIKQLINPITKRLCENLANESLMQPLKSIIAFFKRKGTYN